MTGIIVALPKVEEAKSIRNLLVRNGYTVVGVCTTGAQTIAITDGLNDAVVLCGYKLPDMLYDELHDCLPPGFEMLLMASQHLLTGRVQEDIVSLAMPLKVHDLLSTVDMMVQTMERRRKKRKAKPKVRNSEEEDLIIQAKRLLMERNNMTEEEAHRYIQKCSMDSSTNMVETAQMVLSLMQV
ncbi:MAG: ANTAR domain-containing protein [Lachnospiraceae bacterium]|nr:ANTAR domain-containing protein [Lachnospiraceae bacterium]